MAGVDVREATDAEPPSVGTPRGPSFMSVPIREEPHVGREEVTSIGPVEVPVASVTDTASVDIPLE